MSTTTPSRHAPPPIRAAVFDDVTAADRAVANLLAAGFRAEQVSIICSDTAKRRHFAGLHEEQPSGSHTADATATGGTIGLLAGSLVALTSVAATGGIGLFAAGSIIGAGGITGSFVGAMMTRGIEREAADFYDQELRRGQILLVVEDHSETPHLDDAEHAMHEAGAIPFTLHEG